MKAVKKDQIRFDMSDFRRIKTQNLKSQSSSQVVHSRVKNSKFDHCFHAKAEYLSKSKQSGKRKKNAI